MSAFTCPHCGAVSHNPNDALKRYCGRCHVFVDDAVWVPRFWMNETSGVLCIAVEAYLTGEPMTGEQIAAMRAYLRQWMAAPVWKGPMIDVLRTAVEAITTRADIDRWLNLADSSGIDPL